MKKYIIRDREAGNVIDSFNTLNEAKAELNAYEKEDMDDGTYTPDFYEIVEEDKDVYVSFHVGRGGRFHNPGYLAFRGEYDFQKLLRECSDSLFFVQESFDENGNEKTLPENEWYVHDGTDMHLLDGKEEIEAKTGVLNFDNDYNKDYTTTLDDCNDEEMAALKRAYESVERSFMSDELKQYIVDYFDL